MSPMGIVHGPSPVVPELRPSRQQLRPRLPRPHRRRWHAPGRPGLGEPVFGVYAHVCRRLACKSLELKGCGFRGAYGCLLKDLCSFLAVYLPHREGFVASVLGVYGDGRAGGAAAVYVLDLNADANHVTARTMTMMIWNAPREGSPGLSVMYRRLLTLRKLHELSRTPPQTPRNSALTRQ